MSFRKSMAALQSVLVASCITVGPVGAVPTPAKSTTAISLATPASAQVLTKTPAAPAVEKYLEAGQLQDGETALTADLKKHPSDDQLRFGLGTLQFLRAIEQLSQDFYRYGLRSHLTREFRDIPILRLPIAENPNSETLSYEQLQGIIRRFDDNLCKAEATMAQIKDPAVKLPLHFGLIRLDLNNDGKADESEALWRLYANLNHNSEMKQEAAESFYIKFDRGDVHWFRGYCHLLASFCDLYLAHDSKETFDCTGHLFFRKTDSPYKFLTTGKRVHKIGSDVDVLDFIALIHLIRWQVVDPTRMTSVLHHLESVVAQSKESWKWIMAETTDDHEWLPNPKQTGVLPNMHVTQEMVDAWLSLMDLSGKILAGEVLVPFWRGHEERGINVRKVFLEPRTLDLVLWVQGTAAAPYLETGPKAPPTTWRGLQSAFGNQFPGFAAWFN